MTTYNKFSVFAGGAFTLAALVLAGAAYADDAEVATLTKPESTIGVGAAAVSGDSKDRSIWGQYNGMREQDGYFLLDFDFIRRDDKTGTWTNIMGRNLGLDTRELGFSMNKQGDWKVGLDYSELVHREIRTINTAEAGAGTTTPSVFRLSTPGTGSDLDLEMKRKKVGVDVDKWINSALQVQVNFKNEDKDGARFWGRGYDCASSVCLGQVGTNTTTSRQRWAILMLPEPVNSNTKQIEAKLNYVGQKLGLTGGYYGSFYTNYNGNLTATVPPSLNSPLGTLAPLSGASGAGTGTPAAGTSLQNVLQLPMALAPDNQAHQLYLTGNYAFTPTTRSTFKLAYTHATQNENFGAMGLADGTQPRSDLGGVLDTTLAQLGLTANPMPKLSLNANLRYENKEDKTPIAVYNTENLSFWTNSPTSLRRTNGKLEGSYLLPGQVRGTLGFDYEAIGRALPVPPGDVAGLTGLRGRTQEIGARVELRRSISETLTGAISGGHTKRDGSDWFNTANATYGQNLSNSAIFNRTGIFPYMLADRTRNYGKLNLDWIPTERISFQFMAQGSKDDYNAPSQKGLSDTGAYLYSIDGAYAISEKWRLTGYVSLADQTLGVAQGNSGYVADLRDRTTAFGLGLIGNPTGVLEVGARVSYTDDVTSYGLSVDPNYVLGGTVTSASVAAQQAQAAVGLPDVTYRETRLNLYGKYALQKNADLRLDIVYFNAKLNEWQWTGTGQPFLYQDNTTVGIDPNQSVTYVGLSYIYRMR